MPRRAAVLIETLARAIHYAHEHGVIHRDLKPLNILLAFSREPPVSADVTRSVTSALTGGSRLNEITPKIADFSLAKQVDAGPGPTASSDVMGTPSYMAPEQADGKTRSISPATDVYALGSILYELLTGRPPFRAETPLETLHQVLHEEPISFHRLRTNVPRDLEIICLKCLEKEPGKRYRGAAALAEDLNRFSNGESIQARAWRIRSLAFSGSGKILASVDERGEVDVWEAATGVEWGNRRLSEKSDSFQVACVHHRDLLAFHDPKAGIKFCDLARFGPNRSGGR